LEEKMKNVFLAILLLIPTLVCAEKTKPNPSAYTVAVHVQSSRLVLSCGDVTGGSSVCSWEQHLNVIIDGKKFEIQPGTAKNLLRVGDYKAKIVKDDTPNAYEYQRVYELLFPDGQTRQYSVVGEME
jgi:hypothetical protein